MEIAIPFPIKQNQTEPDIESPWILQKFKILSKEVEIPIIKKNPNNSHICGYLNILKIMPYNDKNDYNHVKTHDSKYEDHIENLNAIQIVSDYIILSGIGFEFKDECKDTHLRLQENNIEKTCYVCIPSKESICISIAEEVSDEYESDKCNIYNTYVMKNQQNNQNISSIDTINKTSQLYSDNYIDIFSPHPEFDPADGDLPDEAYESMLGVDVELVYEAMKECLIDKLQIQSCLTILRGEGIFSDISNYFTDFIIRMENKAKEITQQIAIKQSNTTNIFPICNFWNMCDSKIYENNGSQNLKLDITHMSFRMCHKSKSSIQNVSSEDIFIVPFNVLENVETFEAFLNADPLLNHR